MSSVINFKELKEAIDIRRVVELLDPKLEGETQLKGACPACNSEGALVVSTEKKAFYCHKLQKGGDLISLVAHVNGTNVKDAAQFIVDKAIQSPPQEVEERKPDSKPCFDSSKYLDTLDVEEGAKVLSMKSEVARECGVGLSKKGIHAGRVAIALRDSSGNIKGFISVAEAKLPRPLLT